MRQLVVVAAHDGLLALCTGVGVVVSNFVEAFGEIREKSCLDRGASLVCMTPRLDVGSPDFRPELAARTKAACESTGGRLMAIDSLSDGTSQAAMWGGYEQWKAASKSAAEAIARLAGEYDSVIVFAHDTIFAPIREHLNGAGNVTVIWIPHSLGRVFDDEYTDGRRVALEDEAVRAMMRFKNDRIGYIGSNNLAVLRDKYGADLERLVPFVNGVYAKSSMFDVRPSEAARELAESRIPSDKKLIFCWGRCVRQKAYDVLIPAFGKFHENNPGYHLVLVMPTETSPPEYVAEIRRLVSELPRGSASAFFEFRKNLPMAMLRHPNLGMAVFPSRFEGAPLTPLEALEFAGKGVSFVYSPIPQMREIFAGIGRAVMFSEFSAESIADAMGKAMKARSGGKEHVSIGFVDSYVRGLEAVGGVEK